MVWILEGEKATLSWAGWGILVKTHALSAPVSPTGKKRVRQDVPNVTSGPDPCASGSEVVPVGKGPALKEFGRGLWGTKANYFFEERELREAPSNFFFLSRALDLGVQSTHF